jgi:uncharacterized membrane protein YebE (DUF533 family)
MTWAQAVVTILVALISALAGQWFQAWRDDKRWQRERQAEREKWEQERAREQEKEWMAERRQAYLGFYASLHAAHTAVVDINHLRVQDLSSRPEEAQEGVRKAHLAVNKVADLAPDVDLYCTTKAAQIAERALRLTQVIAGGLLMFTEYETKRTKDSGIQFGDFLERTRTPTSEDLRATMSEFRTQARKDLGIPE